MRRLTSAMVTGTLGFVVVVGAMGAQRPAAPRNELPYSSPEFGFAMTLPAGFLREGEDPLNLRSIACFVSSVADQPGWVRVCVERQGGALPRRAKRMSFTWKGLDVDGAVFESEWVREPVVVYTALVPLRKVPVWLVAMSPPADRGQAQAALVSTLASLQGESAQRSSTERAEGAGRMVGLIVSILIAMGVGMWIAQRRQEKK